MILPDSNILIDVIEVDPRWSGWSSDKLAEASKAGRVITNHIIMAEVAPYSGDLADFLENLAVMGIEVEPLCDRSAYAAGIAFKSYRERRDRAPPKSVLPDFFIGGHALSIGAAILTRDPRFYSVYFPAVPLITPQKDDV